MSDKEPEEGEEAHEAQEPQAAPVHEYQPELEEQEEESDEEEPWDAGGYTPEISESRNLLEIGPVTSTLDDANYAVREMQHLRPELRYTGWRKVIMFPSDEEEVTLRTTMSFLRSKSRAEVQLARNIVREIARACIQYNIDPVLTGDEKIINEVTRRTTQKTKKKKGHVLLETGSFSTKGSVESVKFYEPLIYKEDEEIIITQDSLLTKLLNYQDQLDSEWKSGKTSEMHAAAVRLRTANAASVELEVNEPISGVLPRSIRENLAGRKTLEHPFGTSFDPVTLNKLEHMKIETGAITLVWKDPPKFWTRYHKSRIADYEKNKASRTFKVESLKLWEDTYLPTIKPNMSKDKKLAMLAKARESCPPPPPLLHSDLPIPQWMKMLPPRRPLLTVDLEHNYARAPELPNYEVAVHSFRQGKIKADKLPSTESGLKEYITLPMKTESTYGREAWSDSSVSLSDDDQALSKFHGQVIFGLLKRKIIKDSNEIVTATSSETTPGESEKSDSEDSEFTHEIGGYGERVDSDKIRQQPASNDSLSRQQVSAKTLQERNNLIPKEPKKYIMDKKKLKHINLSYVTTTRKERLLLAHAHEFRRKFERRNAERLLLFVVKNEYDTEKHVCSFILPTRSRHAKLSSMEGIAEFIGNCFELERLPTNITLPGVLRSPNSVIEKKKGNCFELSMLACSLLIGIGFNAYVVQGYAKKEITTCDTTRIELNEKPPRYDQTVSEIEETTPYPILTPPKLYSDYIRSEKQKSREIIIAEVRAFLKQYTPQESPDILEPLEQDLLLGFRVHSWVVVLPNKLYPDMPFFLEPFSGELFPVGAKEFFGIEAVWNHTNYFINMSKKLGGRQEEYWDLTNATNWQPFLLGEPLHMRFIKPGKVIGPNKVIKLEKHLDMPTSWVKKINIPFEFVNSEIINNYKRQCYVKFDVERFVCYTREDGMIYRLTEYKDYRKEIPIFLHEYYKYRKDKLAKRTRNLRTGKMLEEFLYGRPDNLKYHSFTTKDSGFYGPRLFIFRHEFRSDGLKSIETLPSQIEVLYQGREDGLIMRKIEYGDEMDSHIAYTDILRREILQVGDYFKPPVSKGDSTIQLRKFTYESGRENLAIQHFPYPYNISNNICIVQRIWTNPLQHQRDIEPGRIYIYNPEQQKKEKISDDFIPFIKSIPDVEDRTMEECRALEDLVAYTMKMRLTELSFPELYKSVNHRSVTNSYKRKVQQERKQAKQDVLKSVLPTFDPLEAHETVVAESNRKMTSSKAAFLTYAALKDFRDRRVRLCEKMLKEYDDACAAVRIRRRQILNELSNSSINVTDVDIDKANLELYELAERAFTIREKIVRTTELCGTQYEKLKEAISQIQTLSNLRKGRAEDATFIQSSSESSDNEIYIEGAEDIVRIGDTSTESLSENDFLIAGEPETPGGTKNEPEASLEAKKKSTGPLPLHEVINERVRQNLEIKEVTMPYLRKKEWVLPSFQPVIDEHAFQEIFELYPEMAIFLELNMSDDKEGWCKKAEDSSIKPHPNFNINPEKIAEEKDIVSKHVRPDYKLLAKINELKLSQTMKTSASTIKSSKSKISVKAVKKAEDLQVSKKLTKAELIKAKATKHFQEMFREVEIPISISSQNMKEIKKRLRKRAFRALEEYVASVYPQSIDKKRKKPSSRETQDSQDSKSKSSYSDESFVQPDRRTLNTQDKIPSMYEETSIVRFTKFKDLLYALRYIAMKKYLAQENPTTLKLLKEPLVKVKSLERRPSRVASLVDHKSERNLRKDFKRAESQQHSGSDTTAKSPSKLSGKVLSKLSSKGMPKPSTKSVREQRRPSNGLYSPSLPFYQALKAANELQGKSQSDTQPVLSIDLKSIKSKSSLKKISESFESIAKYNASLIKRNQNLLDANFEMLFQTTGPGLGKEPTLDCLFARTRHSVTKWLDAEITIKKSQS